MILNKQIGCWERSPHAYNTVVKRRVPHLADFFCAEALQKNLYGDRGLLPNRLVALVLSRSDLQLARRRGGQELFLPSRCHSSIQILRRQ